MPSGTHDVDVLAKKEEERLEKKAKARRDRVAEKARRLAAKIKKKQEEKS